MHVIKCARALIKATSKIPSREALPERVEAERLWVIEARTVVIQDTKFDTWKKQFSLFLDPHGVWRCGGRLNKANLSYSAKHPVLHVDQETSSDDFDREECS